jgi:hypothetical protein
MISLTSGSLFKVANVPNMIALLYDFFSGRAAHPIEVKKQQLSLRGKRYYITFFNIGRHLMS